MKTKTIRIMLATVVAAIAFNAFVIVSNSNAKINLFKGNVEAFTDPGFAGEPDGPYGNKYASDYNCRMTMSITVTLKKNSNGTHQVSANVSGSSGVLFSKAIDVKAGANYSYTNYSGNEVTALLQTTITDENAYPGIKCDMKNPNIDCKPWHPCGYYHALYAKSFILEQTGYDFN